jgi:hypothetical protein
LIHKINIENMRQLYSLLGGLLLTGMSLHAQTASNAAPAPEPCFTFENAAASTNWVAEPTILVQFVNTNPLDGSTCVTLKDGPYGSIYSNIIDFKNIGQRFPGKCLCFDYYLINDGASGSPLFYPTVYLNDGVNTIAFVSSTAVTEGSGWISVCAPIEHCTGGALPGNANGSWTMSAGMTCTDFNNVLDNATMIYFPTDITSSPSEIMSIDNVCVKDCKGCGLDFDLGAYIRSDGTADVWVSMNVIPNATYSVDWGDGSPVTVPFVSHTYNTAGTYNVCITMVVRKDDGTIINICKKCIAFCYAKISDEGDPKGDLPSKRKETPKMAFSLKDRKFDNENYLIYPNPSQDQATVEITLLEKDHVSVRIMDVLGKVVSEISGDYSAGGQKIKLNTEKLSTGVYNVEITVGDKTSIQKLSIAK